MIKLKSAQNSIFKNQDKEDPRLGQRIIENNILTDLKKTKNPVIWGYPDDEGISLNKGRPGASKAPEQILKYFSKFTPPYAKKFPDQIHFLGLADFAGLNLEEKHQLAKEISSHGFNQSPFCVSLGGGHDFGYPDGCGFLKSLSVSESTSLKPVIVNFDSHLDVRNTQFGYHSGTPFYRLLNEFPDQFDFFEIGLQEHCNSMSHVEWALQKKSKLYFLSEIRRLHLSQVFESYEQKNPCWISLDLDVFSNKEAPGCSAVYSTGLQIEEFLPMLNFLISKFDVRGLGLYEVSPDLDFDDRTSKLAALIAYNALILKSEQTV